MTHIRARRRIMVQLEAPGERVVGCFCGPPHVGTREGEARVWSNFFLPADGSMRVVEGDSAWQRQMERVFAKYGRDAVLYEVALVGPDSDQRTLLPERKLTSRDHTRMRLTAPYDLVALEQGTLDLREVHRCPETAPPERADEPIEADLKGALIFAHTLGMQTKFSTLDARVRLQALVEELVAQGALDLRRMEERQKQIREREAERLAGQVIVNLGPNVDKYTQTDLPQIDCEARIPLCKARCCSLTFNLSVQDLEERVVEWDYSRPYAIRHGANGFCVHNDRETGGCGVYAQRPSVCRTYDCRQDKRIWQDFEKRIIAPSPADDPPGETP